MDIVERLRIRIHTSEDETALTNEAADEIERLREALNEAETICLAQYVTLMCAGENEKASNVKKVADKLITLLKKETE